MPGCFLFSSMLFDSHAHLNHEDFFDDRPAVLDRARSGGVGGIVVVGYDLASSLRAVTIAEQEADCYAAVGIHPHDAEGADASNFDALVNLLHHPRVVALGEIGLDYYRNFSPPEVQRNVFARLLRLARERDKPIIIHHREANDDLIRLLRSEGVPPAGGVLHCFSGGVEWMERVLHLDLHIGMAGPVTFPKADEERRVAAAAPLDRLLIETDSPYLSPVPRRGRRNEPAHLGYIAEQIAAVRHMEGDEVAEATCQTALALFRI